MRNPFSTLWGVDLAFGQPGEHVQRNTLTLLFMISFSLVILALNAAGQLRWGLMGLVGLTFLFLLLGWVGFYWYAASIHFLTQIVGIEPRRSQPWLTSLQGAWPLILLGPSVAAQKGWLGFGRLFTLSVLIGTVVSLLWFLRQAYSANWLQTFLCLGLTGVLSGLALLGLLVWPVMLFLGTKGFGLALSMV
ncbi:MAG: hypothetical protein MH252_18610 [Thermosynechococcaceae cyanobacterium MS004]|nr:hypothetical protein [Thermosynechococcaceae cyanobacterium MS004]